MSLDQPRSMLMVTGALARGGAERQMLALAQGLLLEGWEVQVFELQDLAPGQASFRNEMAALGVRLLSGCMPAASSRKARRRDIEASRSLQPFGDLLPQGLLSSSIVLAATIRAARPDVVYCWSDLSNLVGGLIATQLRVPRVVLGLRTMPAPIWFTPDKAEFYRLAYTRLAAHTAIVFISNSAACAEAFARWVGMPPGRIHRIYNGFLASSFRVRAGDDRIHCRRRFGLPEYAPVVGGVMRFAWEKDPDLWMETAAEIAAVRTDAHFLLAGYGHDNAAGALWNRAVELGIAERLMMPGAVEDVGLIYGASNVLLSTSRTENVPNVLIEAQAAGIPVVGPDVGGISEAMLDGVTGKLVRERSATTLSTAVAAILGNPDWGSRAALEGPRFVHQRFRLERMIAESLAVFAVEKESDTAVSRYNWPFIRRASR